jgi:hypothetical protein
LNATVEDVEKQSITVGRILDLTDAIYAEDSTDEAAQAATSAIQKLIDEAVLSETEELRGALAAMLRNHRYRFPLSGPCSCDACQLAENLLGGNN